MILVDTELRGLGIAYARLWWSTSPTRTTVHLFRGATRDDVDDLVRWAAATGVVLGDVSVQAKGGE